MRTNNLLGNLTLLAMLALAMAFFGYLITDQIQWQLRAESAQVIDDSKN